LKRLIDVERARAEYEAKKESSDESEKEEQKPKSPIKARPQTPANNEDYERKES